MFGRLIPVFIYSKYLSFTQKWMNEQNNDQSFVPESEGTVTEKHSDRGHIVAQLKYEEYS